MRHEFYAVPNCIFTAHHNTFRVCTRAYRFASRTTNSGELVAAADTDLLDLLGFRPWDVYGHAGDPDLRVHETSPTN